MNLSAIDCSSRATVERSPAQDWGLPPRCTGRSGTPACLPLEVLAVLRRPSQLDRKTGHIADITKATRLTHKRHSPDRNLACTRLYLLGTLRYREARDA